jgi:hypothetical protein
MAGYNRWLCPCCVHMDAVSAEIYQPSFASREAFGRSAKRCCQLK